MVKLLKHLYVLSVLAGAGFGAGFLLPGLWPLGFVGGGLVYHLVKTNRGRRVYGILFTVFFVKYLLASAWLLEAEPAGWGVNFSDHEVLILALLAWIWGGLCLALGSGVLGWGGGWFHEKGLQNTAWFPVGIAVLYVFAEVAGQALFALGYAGPHSLLVPAYTFGMSGYLLGIPETGRFIGILGGVYGLSFILLLGSGLVYEACFNRKRWWLIGGVVVAVPGLAFLLDRDTTRQLSVSVVAIETEFIPNLERNAVLQTEQTAALLEAAEVALQADAHTIVFPEDASYFARLGEGNVEQGMQTHAFLDDSETNIIDTTRLETPDGPRLRAYWVSGNETIRTTDKTYLVPHGEYWPYVFYPLYARFFGNDLVADYRKKLLTAPAETFPRAVPVLFCFESTRPYITARIKSAFNPTTAPFIAHPISHAWFRDSTILKQQLDVMLALSARTGNVPIVSAGNFSPSKLYLPTGEIIPGKELASGSTWRVMEFPASGFVD